MASTQCQQYGKAAHIGNRITAADANLGAITFDCAPATPGETLSAAPQAPWPEAPASSSYTPPSNAAAADANGFQTFDKFQSSKDYPQTPRQ
jgi:hypothetical protein